MNEDKKTIVVAMLNKKTKGYGNNEMIRRIYDINGIAPTIRTYGGGNQEPKIMISNKKKKVGGVQVPFNTMPDGTCRTLKNYSHVSAANFLRKSTFGATCVMEFTTDERLRLLNESNKLCDKNKVIHRKTDDS